MISAPDLSQAQLDSPLGRTSPVVKLAVAIGWLVALAFTLEPLPPVAVAILALGAGLWLGQIPIRDLARALAPLWLAAVGIGLFNTLFSPANLDPAAVELITIGPFRITEPALMNGISLALRCSPSPRSELCSRSRRTRRSSSTASSSRRASPSASRTVRWPPTRRSALRRGPRHPAPGAAHPRPEWRLASAAAA